MKAAAALLLFAGLLAGCGLAPKKPRSLPPPSIPTTQQEAATVSHELDTFRFDTHLIENERRSCEKQIGAAQFNQICAPFLTPLAAQRRTHLNGSVGQIRNQVGPRCKRALARVFAVPIDRAEPPLTRASKACQAEYEAAIRRAYPQR